MIKHFLKILLMIYSVCAIIGLSGCNSTISTESPSLSASPSVTELTDNSEQVTTRNLDNIVVDANYNLDSVTYDLTCLNVPYINIDSDDAKRVNEEIYSYFEEIALPENPNPTGDIDRDDYDPWYTYIDYTYYINGDILSVIILQEDGGTAPPFHQARAYNFSIGSGNLLTYEDIATCGGYSADDALNTIIDYASKYVNDCYKEYNLGDAENDLTETYNKNILWFEANEMPWFLNEEGKLCSFIYSYINHFEPSESFHCFTIDGENIAFSAGDIRIVVEENEASTQTDVEINTSTETSENGLIGKWIFDYYYSEDGVISYSTHVENTENPVIEFKEDGTCIITYQSQNYSTYASYVLDNTTGTIYFDDGEPLLFQFQDNTLIIKEFESDVYYTKED